MSRQIMNISPNALKPHPRNEEFFSNAEGEDYQWLKEYIRAYRALEECPVLVEAGYENEAAAAAESAQRD